VAEGFKGISIIAIEAAQGAKPHKALFIFINAVYLIVRQTLVKIEVCKMVGGLLLSRQHFKPEEAEYYKKQ
jgi:hypothetical protein